MWVIFALLDPDPLTRLNPDPIRIRIRNPAANSVARSKQAFTATLGENHGHLGTFHAVLRIRIHRIHMFLGLLDPDPDPASDPDPSLIKQK